MMQPPTQRHDHLAGGEPGSEAGYLLVGVVVMVALVLIALSVAVPVIAKDLRRQKEIESQHRAEQYVRAIRLYYRKTHAYPPSIEALKLTNNVRFLRQEYIDPLTGQSNWKLIHLGEQKTTIKSFFGQELGGIASSGLGSASSLGSGIGTPIGGSSSSNTSTIGATSPLASGFSGASTTTTTSTAGSTGSSGSTGSTGSSGLGGGGAIIGVDTAASGNSLTTPNQQTTYETWEFWYDPRIEQLYAKGKQNLGIGGGTPASQSTSSFGTSLSGQPNSSNGTSSPLSTSPTTTSPSTSTTPQP